MRVSIITVTFNSARTLPDTLQSVLSQDYTDIEHILVDGASTDGTQDIIREYAQQHPSVHYLSEKDSGIYNAINKGLTLATGDIVGILNSDDVLADTNTISTIVKAFTDTHAQVVYGNLIYYNPLTNKVIRHWRSNDFHRSSLSFGWMPAHPTFYCTHEVYKQVGGYDESFRISADYDFMLRVLMRNYHTYYVPTNLIRMSIGGASNRNCRAMATKSSEDLRVLRKNHVGWGVLTVFFKNIRKIRQFL